MEAEMFNKFFDRARWKIDFIFQKILQFIDPLIPIISILDLYEKIKNAAIQLCRSLKYQICIKKRLIFYSYSYIL